MTLGALVDAGVDLATIQAGIDSLGLPSCRLVASEVKKRGFRATQIVVEHEPEHAHRHLHHITAMIDRSTLSPRQRELATKIFGRLAAAEAKVHGSTIEKVHFHEVGAVDSIADIVGAAIGWDLLGVENIIASPVPTGTGFVTIAHGRCAIPAPATAELLCGIPLADFAPEGELTTPTGAAILAALVDDFGPLPAMTIHAIGYGAGQKDFEHANLLRLLVGETDANTTGELGRVERDRIVLLETNIDNATGEQLGHCIEQLWQAGATDVYWMSIAMKKNRPGVLLAVQSPPALVDQLEAIVYRETGTLGIRRSRVERDVLSREPIVVESPIGELHGKLRTLPDGSQQFAPEYESCRAAAERTGNSLCEVYGIAREAFAGRQH